MKKHVSFLIKPAASDCNLFCDYCFYRKTAEDFPETSVHRMSLDTYEELVKKAQIEGREAISYMWQGGEPLLMGIYFFRSALEIQEKYKLPGQSITNTVQTNAVLIDEEFADLFAQHRFLVGVSLDGPSELHDLHRFTRSGKGMFDAVLKACELLEKRRVEFNILAVVNADTVNHPRDIYRFLVEHGFHYLQFIPCIEMDGDELAPFSVPADTYGRFLCTLFDEWLKDGYPYVSIRLFDNLLQYYAGYTPECCMYKDSCGEYLVVEYNGDVFTCDFFVMKDWNLGNILEKTPDEIMKNPKYGEFAGLRKRTCDKCEECEWLGFCQRGCVRMRWLPEYDYSAANYLCTAYRMFLKHSGNAYRFLTWDIIRRHQRQPAPLNVRRNDPCVCGSGKKFKKCCEPYKHLLKV